MKSPPPHGWHGPDRADQVQRCRAPELEDWINSSIYHPLSLRLAKLLRNSPVTPNLVSATGTIFVIMAAFAYASLSYPLSAFLGLALHMSWHVLDGADGDLARLTGRVSPYGEFIDGLCDYIGHIAIYCVLGILVGYMLGMWTIPLVIFVALSRALQASFYETIRRSYEFWAYGREWLGAGIPERLNASSTATSVSWVRAYLSIAHTLLPSIRKIDLYMADPARKVILKDIAKREGDIVLRGIGPLGANFRTLALGAAMMIQQPLLYLLLEAVLLNLIFLLALAAKRRVFLQILNELRTGYISSTLR